MKKVEIERKFLVKEMPNLSELAGTPHERHFLYINPPIELRIQRKGEKYELERKVLSNELSRDGFI